jgi:hypothetical protein
VSYLCLVLPYLSLSQRENTSCHRRLNRLKSISKRLGGCERDLQIKDTRWTWRITSKYANRLSMGARKLYPELIELAKTNIREAMKKEIEINQQLIDSRVVHRNTNRYIKIEVFTAMARNNALHHFLNLHQSQQLPDILKSSIPSEEYKKFMYRISATSYASSVKADAEYQLFRDYTHADYKKKRYFLDESLPEQSKSSKVWGKFVDITGIIISWSFLLGVITLIIWAFWNSDNSSSGTSSHSSTGRGTFGSGGVSGGNANQKSVSDMSQVKDNSQQAGFGNGGKSGHDAPSAGSVSSSNGSSLLTAPVEKPYVLVASYFFPDDADGDFYTMNNGESASLMSRETIQVDFNLPVSSEAIYKVNGKEIKGRAAASNDKNTWFVFGAEEGENVVSVDYKGVTYQYKFLAYSSECFRNQCVM